MDLKKKLYICGMNDTITYKTCTKCGVEKSLNDYYKNNTSKSGYNSVCKTCYKKRASERSKKIYQNKIILDKIIIKDKVCRICNSNKHISSFSKKKENKDGFRHECKICRKLYEDKWKKENPLNVKKNAKKYRDKEDKKQLDREYKKIYMLNKSNNNILFKLKCRISCRIREVIRRKGFTKRNITSQIIGCDWETFKIYIENKFIDKMNWENYGEWHLDHIIPLSSAKTEEDVYRLNHYTNFQPLWWYDNLRKSDKISEEWGNDYNPNHHSI
jgi:hypothetical protein